MSTKQMKINFKVLKNRLIDSILSAVSFYTCTENTHFYCIKYLKMTDLRTVFQLFVTLRSCADTERAFSEMDSFY